MSEESSSQSVVSAPLTLRIVDEQVRKFQTQEPSVSVGADSTCTIQLSKSKSPLECLIVRDGDKTLIRNLESCLLNGQPFRDDVFNAGDVITIGEVTIELLANSVEQQEPVGSAVSSGTAALGAAVAGTAAALGSAKLSTAGVDNAGEGFSSAFNSGVIGQPAASAQPTNLSLIHI